MTSQNDISVPFPAAILTAFQSSLPGPSLVWVQLQRWCSLLVQKSFASLLQPCRSACSRFPWCPALSISLMVPAFGISRTRHPCCWKAVCESGCFVRSVSTAGLSLVPCVGSVPVGLASRAFCRDRTKVMQSSCAFSMKILEYHVLESRTMYSFIRPLQLRAG